MPDTEAIITDGRKVTFSFSRKVNDGNYGSTEASLFITDMVPEGEENILAWVQANAQSAIDTAKAEVWGALGIDFTYDEAGHPVAMETTPAPVPTAPPASAPQAPVVSMPTNPPQQAPQQAFTPPPIPQAQGGDQPTVAQPGYYADMPSFCKNCGNREFWDNRADVDKRIQEGKTCTPDWKCKNQDCKKGVFRPGSFEYNDALKSRNNPPAQAPPQMPAAPPFDPAVDGEPF